jgi:hypothetical protein
MTITPSGEWRFNLEMIMVAHQNVGMNTHAEHPISGVRIMLKIEI